MFQGDNMKFKQELISLPKIGEKYAKDIIDIYPSKDDLILALANGDILPFPEQINNIIIDVYSGERISEKTLNDIITIIYAGSQVEVRRSNNPKFRIILNNGEIQVKKEVANFLLKTRKDIKIKGD